MSAPMSGLKLNTFAENASRLGARLQETISEHTKDLSIRKLGPSYFDLTEDKVNNIRKHLESSSDREKLLGLKRLIALISKGRNVADFFPAVVKNVASHNIEIRKLVYIYLLRHADTDPELALLSINTFQRDLKDPNPLIRSMALRVLSGINNPMIGNIVVLSIKQCAADISPYVRKTAALALIKCYNTDPAQLPAIIPILSTLLKDKSPLSIGTIALAFQSICPTRLDLIHTHYRRFCRSLADVDEWGQIYLVELLSRYASSMLSKPVSDKFGEGLDIDLDLKLLLDSSRSLLMSRNAAVVLAVCRVFYYIAPSSQHKLIVNPLLRLLARSKEVERIVLAYILEISRVEPALFSPSYSRFAVRLSDVPVVKRIKVQLLLNLVDPENFSAILHEFVDYTDDVDDTLISAAIHAIGRCARLIPDSAQQCLNSLVSFIENESDVIVSSAVMELKSLIQSGLPASNTYSNSSSVISPRIAINVIATLNAKLELIKHPAAKACVLWLTGQYAGVVEAQSEQSPITGVAEWAPDSLRRVTKSFSSEAVIVKLQAITLAAKLRCLVPHDHKLSLLSSYIFSLSRYDQDYDVRDRSRMLSALLSGFISDRELNGQNGGTMDRAAIVLRREQVNLIFFEGKMMPVGKNADQTATSDTIGSLNLILGKSIGLDSGRRLPDWPEGGTDPILRDSEDDHLSADFVSTQTAITAISSTSTPKISTPVILTPTNVLSPSGGTDTKDIDRAQWMDIDKFYDEESTEESDTESEVDEHPKLTHEDQLLIENEESEEETLESDEQSSSAEE